MAEDKPLAPRPASQDVQDFLRKVQSLPTVAADGRGRLIFALDATASRQPTWTRASRIQAEMFQQAAALGGIDMQLVFYRGFNECRCTPWLSDADDLLRRMNKVSCLGGQTQIEKVLRHAIAQARAQRVQALVFIGDCMEEDVDRLCALAGELGVLGVPAFLFHEGDDPTAANAFRHIAQLTNGACCRFDPSSPQQLRDLLAAVAVYAAGGRKALMDFGRRRGGMVLQLTHQMKG